MGVTERNDRKGFMLFLFGSSSSQLIVWVLMLAADALTDKTCTGYSFEKHFRKYCLLYTSCWKQAATSEHSKNNVCIFIFIIDSCNRNVIKQLENQVTGLTALFTTGFVIQDKVNTIKPMNISKQHLHPLQLCNYTVKYNDYILKTMFSLWHCGCKSVLLFLTISVIKCFVRCIWSGQSSVYSDSSLKIICQVWPVWFQHAVKWSLLSGFIVKAFAL